MADCCQECSIRRLGEDFGDLAGLTTPADTEKGRHAAVLCECCGFMLVDHTGRRVGSPGLEPA